MKLEETGLCFRGPLPEKHVDECNMPNTEEMAKREELLEDGEMVRALMLAPKRILRLINKLSFTEAI